MKKISLFVFLLIGVSKIFAQFTFSGEITNYNNEIIFIYKRTAVEDEYITKIKTNDKGKFSYTFNEKFEGVIDILLAKEKTHTLFLSDNTNIAFTGVIVNKLLTLTSVNNELNKNFLSYKEKKNIPKKIKYLQELLLLYSKNEPFQKNIRDQIASLNASNSLANNVDNSFLKYYIETETIANAGVNNENEVLGLKKIIFDKLLNDGEELEKSALLNKLIYNFLGLSMYGIKGLEDQKSKLTNAIDDLINEADIESSRGQNILVTIVKILDTYPTLQSISDVYVKKVTNLKCTITTELQNKITQHQNLAIGKVFPNIAFTEIKKGKYKAINEIKATKKIVVVWASWCSHCQDEKPQLIEFYKKFKTEGGEIITLSIETNKKDYLNFHKDVDWIYDSDLKYWSSNFVNILNITGTPTFFILDKDNKILVTKDKVSQVKEFLEK